MGASTAKQLVKTVVYKRSVCKITQLVVIHYGSSQHGYDREDQQGQQEAESSGKTGHGESREDTADAGPHPGHYTPHRHHGSGNASLVSAVLAMTHGMNQTEAGIGAGSS